MASQAIDISLDAVIFAVTDGDCRVLVVRSEQGTLTLPRGQLVETDKKIANTVRRFVFKQTGLELGYVEQLYTFGDRDRSRGSSEQRELSIAYLGLVREAPTTNQSEWVSVYDFLPWEDCRSGNDLHVATLDYLLASLELTEARNSLVERRTRSLFDSDASNFDPVRSLDRYELLYERQLVAEGGDDIASKFQSSVCSRSMEADYRRIVATALSRVRGKMTYRPVVFEMAAEYFTLGELQVIVEALLGVDLHTQNFRRHVESVKLVESTGRTARTRGRPATLFKFRPEVVFERPKPGVA